MKIQNSGKTIGLKGPLVDVPFSFRKTPHLATTMGTYPYMKLLPLSSVREMATFAYLMLTFKGTPKMLEGGDAAVKEMSQSVIGKLINHLEKTATATERV